MTNAQTINLAIGRIFLMASRPEQDGDIAEYNRCRALILDLVEVDAPVVCAPNFARDYGKGAQGQWG